MVNSAVGGLIGIGFHEIVFPTKLYFVQEYYSGNLSSQIALNISGGVMSLIWSIMITYYWVHLILRKYQQPIGLVLKYCSPIGVSYTMNIYQDDCFRQQLVHLHSILPLLLVCLVKPRKENFQKVISRTRG